MLVAAAVVIIAACGAPVDRADNAAALADIRAGRSGDEVVVQGVVTHVFGMTSGELGVHERFDVLISAEGSQTQILVADNVTVGRAAPLHPGSNVVVKGVLEVDPSGPVIHWTHHDPRLRHPPGFVEVDGKLYD